MDGKQFHWRVHGVVGVLLIFILLFAWVLYDLQYVHGADYLAQSRRKIAKTETVEAARGEILDRYGRVLVTNRESYNVSLDTSFMKDVNTTLTKLLDICRTEGVTWADTLPISSEAPFVFTFDTASSGAISNLYALAESLTWTDTLPDREEADSIRAAAQEGQGVSYPSADAFLDKLRTYYEIDPLLPDSELRALVGVRYELSLRSREITYTSYVFAQDVDMPFIVTVKEADLPGVNIDTTTVREYKTPYAAHLLGRVGPIYSDEWSVYQELGYDYNAIVGKEGVELAFESYLHGTPGKRNIETNDQGKVVSGDDNWVVDQATGEVLAPDPGDNVILTLDIKLQEVVERALALHASCVILCQSSLAEHYRDLHSSTCIIATPCDAYRAARMLYQAIPVSRITQNKGLVYFHLSDYIDDVRDTVLQSRYRSYPILDEDEKVVGTLGRYHLIRPRRKRVVLVDHNETAQSVPGLDQAEIMEIIDHHRLADVQTGNPVFMRNEPVGSTTTIIASMYQERGLMPSEKLAGLMAAAILSDTVLFKSPTCTPRDKRLAERLDRKSVV